MVKQSDRDSMVAVQLVGLEENIAKARQLIECKLDTIKVQLRLMIKGFVL